MAAWRFLTTSTLCAARAHLTTHRTLRLPVDAERFEEVAGQVDVVLDTIGGDVLRRSAAVIRPGGTLVSVTARPKVRPADGRAVATPTASTRCHGIRRVPLMAQPDSEARALLDRWATSPARPVKMLTAEDVRRDDLAVLDLQRAPGELYSVEDVEAPGPAGAMKVRLYRPHPGRLHPVLFLHGGGFVIGG